MLNFSQHPVSLNTKLTKDQSYQSGSLHREEIVMVAFLIDSFASSPVPARRRYNVRCMVFVDIYDQTIIWVLAHDQNDESSCPVSY